MVFCDSVGEKILNTLTEDLFISDIYTYKIELWFKICTNTCYEGILHGFKTDPKHTVKA